MSGHQRPMFSAVSSSVRHLTQILKCISFSSKAHAQISDVGIRFSVQESRVMQGRSEIFPSFPDTYVSKASHFYRKSCSLVMYILRTRKENILFYRYLWNLYWRRCRYLVSMNRQADGPPILMVE